MIISKTLTVPALSLFACFSLQAADSIGWNYDGAFGNDTLASSDLAGPAGYAQTHWNNHAAVGQAPGLVPFPLVDHTGAPTTVSVTAWTQKSNDSNAHGTSNPSPNAKLLESFADKEPAVTFSGIPVEYTSGGYTVVVYYNSSSPLADSVLAIEGSRNDSRMRTVRTGDAARYDLIGFVEETGALAGPTNFSVFTRLNDPEFTVSLTNSNHNGLCAVQIIREDGPPFPESTDPVTPASPANGMSGFNPWQPLTWIPGGEGELNYDVYLWADGEPKPATPTATVTKSKFIPYAYFEINRTYHWQVVTHLEISGNTLVSDEFSFTTGGLDGQPPFDVSPSGQAVRTASVESLKGIDLLVSDLGNGYPLLNPTTLAFHGDSITDFYYYYDGIKNALEQARTADPDFPEVTILNRGINGATAEDLLTGTRRWGAGGGLVDPLPFDEQVDSDLAEMSVGGLYVAVIQIGINDVYQGFHTSKADYKARVDTMVAHVLSRGQLVVLVSPNVIGESPIADIIGDGLYDDEGNSLLNQYVEALEEIGAARGVPVVNQRQVYLDILRNENVVVDEEGELVFPQTAGILNVDAVHPNARGKALSSELAALGIFQAVTGFGAPGEVDVSPTAVDFGTHATGSSSTASSVIVSNIHSEYRLLLTSASITGSDAAAFALVGGGSGIVSENGTFPLQVVFTPTRVGEHFANLEIRTNDADEPVTIIPLSGEGVAVPPGTPIYSSPANGADGVNLTPTLRWEEAAGAVNYDVFFWRNGDPMPEEPTATVSTLTYQPPTLALNSTYRWKIVANNPGGFTEGETWTFQTQSELPLSIGWNYIRSGTEAIASADMAGAGAYKQSHWNNHSGVNQGPGALPFALVDSQGAATTASVTAWIHQYESHSNSFGFTSPLTPDDQLMNSYANQGFRLTFSGIPSEYVSSGYSVVVYYTTKSPVYSATTLSILDSTGNTLASALTYTGENGTAGRSSYREIGFVEGDGTAGKVSNYTVFRDLEEPTFTVFLDSRNHNGVSAIQIVQNSTQSLGVSYQDWSSSYDLEGDQLEFSADPDHDGVPNGIEYLIGGQPNPSIAGSDSRHLLVPLEVNGDSVVYTFTWSHAARSLDPIIEFSSSLDGEWVVAADPGNATIITTPGENADTVRVVIPKGDQAKLFVRLRVAAP